MFTYWLVFLFFAIFAMIGKARIPIIANYPHKLNIDFMWLFIIIFLTVFIGFRFEVGGDWGAYLMYYDSFSGIYLRDAFNITSDPGYILINWASSELGWGIYGVNTICGFIFALGLAIFCRNLPRPLLALLAAIPYLLIVVGMGYSRQGVALGFAMMGFVALGREKKLLLLALAALSIGLIFLLINNTFNSYAQSKKKADKARSDYEYVISKAELLSSSLLGQSSNTVSIENFIRSNISVQSNNLKVSNQDGLIKISFSSDSLKDSINITNEISSKLGKNLINISFKKTQDGQVTEILIN